MVYVRQGFKTKLLHLVRKNSPYYYCSDYGLDSLLFYALAYYCCYSSDYTHKFHTSSIGPLHHSLYHLYNITNCSILRRPSPKCTTFKVDLCATTSHHLSHVCVQELFLYIVAAIIVKLRRKILDDCHSAEELMIEMT